MTAPPPVATDLAGTYFLFHQRHELRLQRCADCGRWQHPPLVTCPVCASDDLVWETVRGNGTVFSWTVTRYPLVPSFAERLPYINAVVETEEGPRIFALLTGIEPDAVRCGQPVVVDFVDVNGLHLAVFRPA